MLDDFRDLRHMLAEKAERYDEFYRARFCALLGPCAGLAESASDLFLPGLLSAMDAILDMRMPDVPREIAIREDIRDDLLGKVRE